MEYASGYSHQQRFCAAYGLAHRRTLPGGGPVYPDNLSHVFRHHNYMVCALLARDSHYLAARSASQASQRAHT